MTTYEIYTKADDKVWLYSDDTYTLAISDCSDPEIATETTETTPIMLADIFLADALKNLLGQMIAKHEAGEISIHELAEAEEKLGKAIAIAEAEAGKAGR